MTRHATSARFWRGTAAGQRDKELVESCPAQPPEGPELPEGYPNNMWHRGYHAVFDDAVPHTCTKECQREKNGSRQ